MCVRGYTFSCTLLTCVCSLRQWMLWSYVHVSWPHAGLRLQEINRRVLTAKLWPVITNYRNHGEFGFPFLALFIERRDKSNDGFVLFSNVSYFKDLPNLVYEEVVVWSEIRISSSCNWQVTSAGCFKGGKESLEIHSRESQILTRHL